MKKSREVFPAWRLCKACHQAAAPAQAATVDVAFMGSSDQSLVGSSDMTWVVSNGDLGSVPPLGIGQEVLSGGYQDGYILTSPSQYESSQVLNNSDIVH
ncbi:MAG: hypothetical protein WCK53_16080, partial [Methanomicrobiales archaeon]